jgi:hypothetical protein
LVETAKEKVELGSEAWMDLATQILTGLVAQAGASIADEHLTVCEVFVDPPAHLRRDGSNEIAWSFKIADGATRVARRAAEGADFSLRADYQYVLPSARTVLGSSAEEVEDRSSARREAIAARKVVQSGSLETASPAMRAVLLELHNRLVPWTA